MKEKQYYAKYKKAPTPFFDRFQIYWQKVSAHSMDIDPAILYAEAFDQFVIGNIENVTKIPYRGKIK